MKVGDTVHIDTDNEEWGRVASDGVVLEIGKMDALINAESIRANILVPLSDISETGGGGPGEAGAAMRAMNIGRIAARLLRGGAAPMNVIQDGREFYNDATGDELFQSSIVVADGDLQSAVAARQEFTDWCERNGIVPTFMGA